jgi:hypothetical protein
MSLYKDLANLINAYTSKKFLKETEEGFVFTTNDITQEYFEIFDHDEAINILNILKKYQSNKIFQKILTKGSSMNKEFNEYLYKKGTNQIDVQLENYIEELIGIEEYKKDTLKHFLFIQYKDKSIEPPKERVKVIDKAVRTYNPLNEEEIIKKSIIEKTYDKL